MKISVLTNDRYLYRHIELELDAPVISYADGVCADILILDCDTADEPSFKGKIVRLSREEKADTVRLPLPLGRLRELCSEKDENAKRLLTVPNERCAILDGKRIKLTSHEYSLLSLLISKGGDYACREEIAKNVFGGASDGLINLYVHYLREKLEDGSEKIIISSRSQGYRINRKYLGGAVC